MGVVGVEEFPYYAYRRYPFGAQQRVPVYNPYYKPYYDTSINGGNSAPIFVVEAPFTREADLVRKRKLGEDISSSAGHNARNVSLGNVAKSSAASTSSSKPVWSPVVSSTPATKLPELGRGNATESKHSSPSSSEKRSSRPRIISIPVISTDDGGDNSVKCTVKTDSGPKKSRKVVMSTEGAAVLIQSSFRAFQVRKTGPLPQLRLIAKVKSQLMELDEKASDVDFINYVRENSAARVKLTEDIMKLLLRLDAIQGAHPVVRDIRKLATKAVIALQERVDALLLPTEVAAFVNIDEKDVPRGTDTDATCAKTEVLQNTEEGAENAKNDCNSSPTQEPHPDSTQANGEVGSAEGDDHEERQLEASRADIEESGETRVHLPTSMVEPDPDQGDGNGDGDGDGDVDTVESSVEPMDVEAVKGDTVKVNKSSADEAKRVDLERDQRREALHAHHERVVGNDDDGAKLDEGVVGSARVETLPESVDVTTVGISDERPVQSDNASEASPPPQEGLQMNEEERREGVDDEATIGDSALRTADDLSEPNDDDDDEDSSRPHSPRSPFEASDYLDFPASVSDGELQSESPELPAQGEGDSQALLLKLSEENKTLKSLLVTVMKWNQVQATAMQNLNQRLGKLESSRSPRNGKKKSNSRRKVGKSRRMMF